MKAYERMRASPAGNVNLDKFEEPETPTNDSRGLDQPGPSSRPPAFTYTPAPLSTLTTSGETTMGNKNLAESNALEPDSTQGFGLDGLMNLAQMGGIEMFFSQSMWPENVLLGQVGESGSGEAGAFDFTDLFGLYDTQPQL